ncbi:MAG: hypothetical protein M1828_006619 [Chrysothrix sp. TS-e1954]|nr:MAG: hypothetical protein M1828_006619 [Chrysothrix sp. TS-e1954]
MEYDPLLYAMLGFAAYMHTVSNPAAELQDFLPFYSKSLALLRQELQNEKQPSLAVLLTILQLTLLEEYLGDWVNLLGHQKAAYRILTSIYTPEAIAQDKVHNVVLEWYLRFDLTAGFLAGKETTLDEPWFVAQHQGAVARKDRDPEDIRAKIAGIGQIDQETVHQELNRIRMRFTTWYKDVDSSLFDAEKMAALPVMSKGKEGAEGISPFHNDIWASRFMLLKFWGTELLLNAQVAQIEGDKSASENASRLASRIFQMFEAIQHEDQTPGACIGAQNAFNLACVFLGNDPVRVASCRRKLARIEGLGYIYPSTLRARLSDVWDVDVKHWWLENDEGYSPINKKIREFVNYRTRTPTDDVGQAMRDLRGIFEGLNLGESPRPDRDFFGLNGVLSPLRITLVGFRATAQLLRLILASIDQLSPRMSQTDQAVTPGNISPRSTLPKPVQQPRSQSVAPGQTLGPGVKSGSVASKVQSLNARQQDAYDTSSSPSRRISRTTQAPVQQAQTTSEQKTDTQGPISTSPASRPEKAQTSSLDAVKEAAESASERKRQRTSKIPLAAKTPYLSAPVAYIPAGSKKINSADTNDPWAWLPKQDDQVLLRKPVFEGQSTSEKPEEVQPLAVIRKPEQPAAEVPQAFEGTHSPEPWSDDEHSSGQKAYSQADIQAVEEFRSHFERDVHDPFEHQMKDLIELLDDAIATKRAQLSGTQANMSLELEKMNRQETSDSGTRISSIHDILNQQKPDVSMMQPQDDGTRAPSRIDEPPKANSTTTNQPSESLLPRSSVSRSEHAMPGKYPQTEAHAKWIDLRGLLHRRAKQGVLEG